MSTNGAIVFMSSPSKENLSIAIVGKVNSGKTSLARTLLRRPVGAVGDRANVTREATSYPDEELGLTIVDCPGFQDAGSYYAYLVALRHSETAAAEIKGSTDFTWDDRALGAIKSCNIALYVAPLDDVPTAGHQKELKIITENATAVAILNKRKATERALGVGAVNDRERQWRATLQEFGIVAVDYDAHVASPAALTSVLDLIRSKIDQAHAHKLDRYIKARERRRAEQRGQVAEWLASDLIHLKQGRVEIAIARSEYQRAVEENRAVKLANEMLGKRVRDAADERLGAFVLHSSEVFGFRPDSDVRSELAVTDINSEFDPGSGGAAAGYGLAGAYVGAHVGGIATTIIAGAVGFLFGGPIGAAAAASSASLWGVGAGAVGGAALGASAGLQGDSEARAWFQFRDESLYSYACTAASWATALAYHGFGKGAIVSRDEAISLGNAVASELSRTRPADLAEASEELLTRWGERSLEALEI